MAAKNCASDGYTHFSSFPPPPTIACSDLCGIDPSEEGYELSARGIDDMTRSVPSVGAREDEGTGADGLNGCAASEGPAAASHFERVVWSTGQASAPAGIGG